MVQALSSHTAQKAFADRIGAWRMNGRCEYLDAAGCGHVSETGSKLAIMITDEVLRRLSVRSRLPELLSSPRVGRKPCHPDMDHSPRFELDDEEREERTEAQVSDVQEIASPDQPSMIAQEGCPALPS
jgi:hypothetical protein